MSIGPWQVVLILVIILVLFGAGKLPSVMKDLAKGVQAFKQGLKEEETDSKANTLEERETTKLQAPSDVPEKETPQERPSSHQKKKDN